MRRYAIGIDIGGTNTRTGLVDLRHSSVLLLTTKTSLTPRFKAKFLDKLFYDLGSLLQEVPLKSIVGIGLGIPGPLDPSRKKVLNPPNVPQIANLALGKIIASRFHIPVKLENDANCFTLAEAQFGAGRGYRRVLGITFGTGVGGGLVVDGKIYSGATGSAGEIGHMVVEANGRRCTCGGRGHFEEYVSKRAFMRLGKKDPYDLKLDLVRGNKKARRIFETIGEYLGLGIASAVNLWDPDVIVVGGGIVQGVPLLLNAARRRAKKEIISPLAKKNLKIKLSRFGIWAGTIGAAALWLY